MGCSGWRKNLGGRVEPVERGEYGPAQLNVENRESELFQNFPHSLRIWNSHGDNVLELPQGFHPTGKTANAIASAEDPQRKIYTVQFHPEVKHTERGTEILRNFLFTVCKAEPKWSGAAFIEETVEAMRAKVGIASRDLRVKRGSGLDCRGGTGAPSDRRAADEYFREYGTTAEKRIRTHTGDVPGTVGTASDWRRCHGPVPGKLKGVSDPEKKRKIIGNEFIEVFAAEAEKLQKEKGGDIQYWCRGRCTRT